MDINDFKNQNEVDELAYLKERLNNQIEWYDKKSKTNKIWYLSLKTISYICMALTPFILAVGWPIYYSGGTSLVTLICESIMSLFNYKELWITYRQTTELLTKERVMFQTSTGIYRETEFPFADLVERCETIISKENINWTNLTQNDKKPKVEEKQNGA